MQNTTKVNNLEPDYAKFYSDAISKFNGLERIPIDFILALLAHTYWNGKNHPMLFQNTKPAREKIQTACGIKKDMYAKYISRCVKNGLLVNSEGYRTLYYVNPFFIARGTWSDVKQQRAYFIYTDGNWSCNLHPWEN